MWLRSVKSDAPGIDHSNDIFINHVKPMSLASALRLGYHNARAGAALQRDLAIPARNVLYEGCLRPAASAHRQGAARAHA
jgi:hypothetical protein